MLAGNSKTDANGSLLFATYSSYYASSSIRSSQTRSFLNILHPRGAFMLILDFFGK